jgi:choline dehydrogenase
MKAEAFSPPTPQQTAKGAQYINSYHGYTGPVQVKFPEAMHGGPQQGAFTETIMSITGIERRADVNGGAPNGVSFTPLTMTSWNDDHRSSSVDAYLTPVESVRTNWTTLTNHMVLFLQGAFIYR